MSRRWQFVFGVGLLLAAAIIAASYELGFVGGEPANVVALIFAVLGGSALGKLRRKSGSASN